LRPTLFILDSRIPFWFVGFVKPVLVPRLGTLFADFPCWGICV